MTLLSVDHLRIAFPRAAGEMVAVRDLSFTVAAGETVALVGASGSGKTVSALAIPGLLPPPPACYVRGSVRLLGEELSGRSERELARVRGAKIGMVFQEPMTALNPLHTIGRQIAEPLRLHTPLDRAARRARVVELLARVGLGHLATRLDAFPHQLSGGERQRVMIASAIACNPALLIADEPTTALDVTVQAQVLALLKSIQAECGMGLLFISHDLGIVRQLADRMVVLKDGEAVEQGEASDIFAAPKHAYTRALMQALLPDTPPVVPPLPLGDYQCEGIGSGGEGGAQRLTAPSAVHPAGDPHPNPLPEGEGTGLRLDNVGIAYPHPRPGLLGWLRAPEMRAAVREVSVSLPAGHTLGIVGESGSGKTTLALGLLRLLPQGAQLSGTVWLGANRLDTLPRAALRGLRKEMQFVFQDPYGSLNPRLNVGELVAEGLRVHAPALSAAAREAKVAKALAEVGMPPESMGRYPHAFSGGQRQRIAIARALVLEPKLIVLDEPTSALDVLLQAQIVELLRELQTRLGLSYLVISHDMRVVRALAHEVLVLRHGEVVERGAAATIFAAPKADYTRTLMQAAFTSRLESVIL